MTWLTEVESRLSVLNNLDTTDLFGFSMSNSLYDLHSGLKKRKYPAVNWEKMSKFEWKWSDWLEIVKSQQKLMQQLSATVTHMAISAHPICSVLKWISTAAGDHSGHHSCYLRPQETDWNSPKLVDRGLEKAAWNPNDTLWFAINCNNSWLMDVSLVPIKLNINTSFIIHPLMTSGASVSLNGYFQRDNLPCHKA